MGKKKKKKKRIRGIIPEWVGGVVGKNEGGIN